MANSGIEQLVWVDPTTLSPNPLNWKHHPQSQMEGVNASIKKNGWVKPLIYNKTTQRLLDGHGRQAEAIKRGDKSVPVIIGSWTEEQEHHILQTLDPLGSMFRTDSERLASLNALVAQQRDSVASLGKENREALQRLQKRIEALPQAIEEGRVGAIPLPLAEYASQKKIKTQFEEEAEEEESDEPTGEDVDYTTKVLRSGEFQLASSNEWGIPDLDPQYLATADMLPDITFDRSPKSLTVKSYYCQSARPFTVTGTSKRREKGGCLGFFTEDWRFEGFYEDPEAWMQTLLQEDWTCLLQPDYSIYEEWPFVMNLWNLFRSRWVAAYWQKHKQYVLPVLQSPIWKSSEYHKGEEVDIVTDTLPANIPAFAVQCRTLKQNGGDFKAFGAWLANRVVALKPEAVLIYGGLEHQSKFVGYLPRKQCRYVMLESFMAGRRRQMKENLDG